mgnify:CR=1 FL=1
MLRQGNECLINLIIQSLLENIDRASVVCMDLPAFRPWHCNLGLYFHVETSWTVYKALISQSSKFSIFYLGKNSVIQNFWPRQVHNLPQQILRQSSTAKVNFKDCIMYILLTYSFDWVQKSLFDCTGSVR